MTLLAATTLLVSPVRGADTGSGSNQVPQRKMRSGVAFVSGGVSKREMNAMGELESSYNTKLIFTDPSGRYLARVDLEIQNGEKTVLKAESRGPVFLVNLEPGTYAIEAKRPGKSVLKKTIAVPKTGRSETHYTLGR